MVIVISKYEINLNIFLICRRFNDSMWYCFKFDIMMGKFNLFSGILDINFKFNFMIYVGYYVRLIFLCDGN